MPNDNKQNGRENVLCLQACACLLLFLVLLVFISFRVVLRVFFFTCLFANFFTYFYFCVRTFAHLFTLALALTHFHFILFDGPVVVLLFFAYLHSHLFAHFFTLALAPTHFHFISFDGSFLLSVVYFFFLPICLFVVCFFSPTCIPIYLLTFLHRTHALALPFI
jgi:hypothetical protein